MAEELIDLPPGLGLPVKPCDDLRGSRFTLCRKGCSNAGWIPGNELFTIFLPRTLEFKFLVSRELMSFFLKGEKIFFESEGFKAHCCGDWVQIHYEEGVYLCSPSRFRWERTGLEFSSELYLQHLSKPNHVHKFLREFLVAKEGSKLRVDTLITVFEQEYSTNQVFPLLYYLVETGRVNFATLFLTCEGRVSGEAAGLAWSLKPRRRREKLARETLCAQYTLFREFSNQNQKSWQAQELLEKFEFRHPRVSVRWFLQYLKETRFYTPVWTLDHRKRTLVLSGTL